MNGFQNWLRNAGYKMRSALQHFMSGRYGTDKLNMALLCTGLVCSLLASFLPGALLKLAFMTRATAIIGPPQIILGLSKLGKATGTPLYIKCAVVIGTDCTRWMQEDIHRRLDCQIVDCSSILPDEKREDEDVCKIAADILRWSSVLDCTVQKSEYGLEMELVTFAGEKLPKMPTCAKRKSKNWEPEKDMPFWLIFGGTSL